jgi:hypothetical protein
MSYKKFDWIKAANILIERNPKRASAGLIEDWLWTGDKIWDNGVKEDSFPQLCSSWATPVLLIEGEEIECWVSGTFGDEESIWPKAARDIISESSIVLQGVQNA